MRKIKEKISWILSDSAEIDPTQDLEELKKIGPLWGSWRTWRAHQTDNVICHDQVKAAELTHRGFQNSCNLYISDSVHASLDRPDGVKIYAGEFVHDSVRQEEIVAMHLAATTSDIVIMLGYDLSKLNLPEDRLEANRLQHHRNMIRQALITYENVQWVCIDHPEPFDVSLQDLPNLVTDSLSSVLALA